MSLAPPSVDLLAGPGRDGEAARRLAASRAVARSPKGRVGLLLLAVVLFVILFGRFFTPYPPDAIGVGLNASGPSGSHLLGTDSLGRDTFSRLLVGGSTIVVIPLVAVLLSLLVGGTFGMVGAYGGGLLDGAIVRAFDVLMALPPLLVALVAIAAVGTSSVVLVITITLVYVPRMGRLVRGATQDVVKLDYVAAAQARGERTAAILFREVLPNIVAPTIADFALRITYAVIFVATLNFLGLGVQPPRADWGVMVAEGRGFINLNPMATLAPAAAIALLSVALNLIADTLTDHLTRTRRETIPL